MQISGRSIWACDNEKSSCPDGEFYHWEYLKGSGHKYLQAHAMTQSRFDDDCKQKPTITEWRAQVRRKCVSDSNPQIIFGRHAQYNVAVSLKTELTCQIVIIISTSQMWPSPGKRTLMQKLNGKKLMANERLVSGSSKHFIGWAKISNGFGKHLNGLIFQTVCLTCRLNNMLFVILSNLSICLSQINALSGLRLEP